MALGELGQRRRFRPMARRVGLFSWYVANFGSFNATYGSLGAVIGFMTWMWISTIVILLGAELNAELERGMAKDAGQR